MKISSNNINTTHSVGLHINIDGKKEYFDIRLDYNDYVLFFDLKDPGLYRLNSFGLLYQTMIL